MSTILVNSATWSHALAGICNYLSLLPFLCHHKLLPFLSNPFCVSSPSAIVGISDRWGRCRAGPWDWVGWCLLLRPPHWPPETDTLSRESIVLGRNLDRVVMEVGVLGWGEVDWGIRANNICHVSSGWAEAGLGQAVMSHSYADVMAKDRTPNLS